MTWTRRKVLTGIAWAAAAAAVLTIAGLVTVVLIWNPAELAAGLSAKLTARTGREVAIEGPVTYKLAWRPTVSAEGVRIGNAPWGTRPDMVRAARVDVQIALLPLLAGDVRIRGVALVEPDILLEVGPKGRGNWQMDRAEPSAPATEQRLTAGLASLRIERGTIAYVNAASGRKLHWVAERLGIDGDRDDTAVFAEGEWNGVPVRLQATLPPIAEFAAGKHRSVVDLSTSGLKVHAEGVVPVAPSQENADFAFTAKVDDWKSTAKLLQRDLGHLPPLSARGHARMDARTLLLDPVELTAGKSSVNARLELSGDDRSRDLALHLEAPHLDLGELLGKERKRAADGRIFSADPLPVAWLSGLSGKAEASIARLVLRDGRTAGSLRATALFEKGVMRMDPAELQLAGKPLRIRLRADAREPKRLGVDLAVDGTAIPFGALASLFGMPAMIEGSPTDVHLRLSSAGNSVRAIMAGANADLRLVAGPGRLRHRGINVGADVTELLKTVVPTQAEGTHTDLECAVARLPVRGGVAQVSNSIALQTAKVDLIAAGTIDLRQETVDLGLRTRPATGLGIGIETLEPGLARLRGPLAKPDVQVDMAGAAKVATHIGLAAATGGLSLIASGLLADRVPDEPCQAALNAKAATRTEGKGSVVDDILGGVKKLFGG